MCLSPLPMMSITLLYKELDINGHNQDLLIHLLIPLMLHKEEGQAYLPIILIILIIWFMIRISRISPLVDI